MATIERNRQQLIARRFQRAAQHYRQNAVVQQAMARDLFDLAKPTITHYLSQTNRTDRVGRYANPSTVGLNVLEIGCGSGLLTEVLCQNLPITRYIANDLYDVSDSIMPIFQHYHVDGQCVVADACCLSISDKQDIIAGGAILQWIEQPARLFDVLFHNLKDKGLVLLSGFSPDNYHEMKTLTGQGLVYPDKGTLQSAMLPFFHVISVENQRQTLYFEHPQAVLQHIKKTGVNALRRRHWTKADLQQFIKAYERLKTDQGYPLTYTPQLWVLQKK